MIPRETQAGNNGAKGSAKDYSKLNIITPTHTELQNPLGSIQLLNTEHVLSMSLYHYRY